MKSAIGEMLQSKKFTAALTGCMGLIAGALSGQMSWKEAIIGSVSCIIAVVLGQGMADAGKEKAKLEVAINGKSSSDKAAILESELK